MASGDLSERVVTHRLRSTAKQGLMRYSGVSADDQNIDRKADNCALWVHRRSKDSKGVLEASCVISGKKQGCF